MKVCAWSKMFLVTMFFAVFIIASYPKIGFTAPVLEITCPPDITIECDESSDPSNTGYPSVPGYLSLNGGCSDITVTYTDSVIPGTCTEEYTITRTWIATDSCGANSSCDQTIDKVDTTPPNIKCNAPTTITPPDSPITFIATATDNCEGNPSVDIIAYDCFSFSKKGKRIDKTESCIVEVNGNTITIVDSGGVDNNITWRVDSKDNCGNDANSTCSVVVVNPVQP